MRNWVAAALAAVVMMGASARPASADWLLTGFVAPIFGVKTAASDSLLVPEESFDSSVGFGVNLASAFPTRGNLGFELDWAYFPEGLKTSDQFGTDYASRLMTVSTNFFYSPGIPRFRPYFTVGPTFSYRTDADEAIGDIPSGWAVGVNGGGGLFAFINPRFAARVDLRYLRNFGDFYDLQLEADQRQSGWKDLQYFRLFFGGTFAL